MVKYRDLLFTKRLLFLYVESVIKPVDNSAWLRDAKSRFSEGKDLVTMP